MEELQVGDYTRSTDGEISKLLYKTKYDNGVDRYVFENDVGMSNPEYYIVKHSKNKIDLIEIGDYANGEYVYELGNSENGDKWVHTLNGHLYYEKDIKIIWTKEQLKTIEYNVD